MILEMHAPEMAGNAEVTKAMQKQLIEVQKTDQAWGLTEGLIHHPVSHAEFPRFAQNVSLMGRVPEPHC